MSESTFPASSALKNRTIAVTGATGFIGAAVTRALVAGGAGVQAPCRRASGLPPRVLPVTVRRFASAALASAFAGCDTVVHLAYDMRAGTEANVALFTAMLDGARAAGVTRIVHAGSVAEYDDWPTGGCIDEDSSRDGPPKTAYVDAKRQMERLLASSGLASVTLLPTIVYGSRRALWTRDALGAMAAGGMVLPDPPGLCPAVHVEDVAHAACRAVERVADLPAGTAERYLVSGPDRPSWFDFCAAHRDLAGGGEIRMIPVEALLATVGTPVPGQIRRPGLAARAGGLARAALGHDRVDRLAARLARTGSGPRMPGPLQLQMLMASPKISAERARDQLLWEPRIGFDPRRLTQ